jgi:hypothetical protein
MITPENEKNIEQLNPILSNENYNTSNDNSNNQLIDQENTSYPSYEAVMQQNQNMYPDQNINMIPPQQNINMIPPQQNINVIPPQQNINMIPQNINILTPQQNINMLPPQQNINMLPPPQNIMIPQSNIMIPQSNIMIPQSNIMIPQSNIMIPQNPQNQILYVQSNNQLNQNENVLTISGRGVKRITDNEYLIRIKYSDISACSQLFLIIFGFILLFNYSSTIIGLFFLILGISRFFSYAVKYYFFLEPNNIKFINGNGCCSKKMINYNKGQILKFEFYCKNLIEGNSVFFEHHILIYTNNRTEELLNIKCKKELFTKQEIAALNLIINNHINKINMMQN